MWTSPWLFFWRERHLETVTLIFSGAAVPLNGVKAFLHGGHLVLHVSYLGIMNTLKGGGCHGQRP